MICLLKRPLLLPSCSIGHLKQITHEKKVRIDEGKRYCTWKVRYRIGEFGKKQGI